MPLSKEGTELGTYRATSSK